MNISCTLILKTEIVFHPVMNYCDYFKVEPKFDIFFLVPKPRVQDVQVTDVGDTEAKLTWRWDEIWSREEGEMKFIQGEMKGFRV